MKIELLDTKCLPKYQQSGDACVDCKARTDVKWKIEDDAYVAYVPLGFKVEVPRGYVMLLFSRSGQGWMDNVTLANSVGVIDSGFREEVQCKLIKNTDLYTPIPINQYDRVCQAIILERPKIYWDVVDKITKTNRSSGFGSTGKK